MDIITRHIVTILHPTEALVKVFYSLRVLEIIASNGVAMFTGIFIPFPDYRSIVENSIINNIVGDGGGIRRTSVKRYFLFILLSAVQQNVVGW